MSWWKKAQIQTPKSQEADMRLSALLDKAGQGSMLFENELVNFQGYSPDELIYAYNMALQKFQDPNEPQNAILSSIQAMISGVQQNAQQSAQEVSPPQQDSVELPEL